jgi:putative salt-induced outer membrane protein
MGQGRGRRMPVLVAFLMMASVRTARAQAPAAPSSPPPSANPVTVQADVGFVSTSGNSVVTTLNVSDAVTLRTSPDNKVGQTFGLVYGTLRNRVQTSLWTAGLRDDYTFTPTIGVFALVGFDRNTFAGVDHRFEEGVGVALVAVHAPRDRLEFDLGVSYIEQRSTTAVEHDYPAGRLALAYRHSFGKDTYFEQTIEGVPDLTQSSDYRINTQSSVVAPLSKHVAIKLGYAIRYANLPPPGFKTTDRLFTSDVQVAF